MKCCRVRCFSFIGALHRFAPGGSSDMHEVQIWLYMSMCLENELQTYFAAEKEGAIAGGKRYSVEQNMLHDH